MDPNVMFSEFLDALREGDPSLAEELFGDLAGWLRMGGFKPSIDTNQLLSLMDRALRHAEMLESL